MPDASSSPPVPTLVLLDANALFLPFRSGIDLEQEVARLLPGSQTKVPSSVLRELLRLRRRGVAQASAAELLAKRFPELPTDLEGDAALETLAKELGAWVVTADQQLRERLQSQGIGVVFPREQQRLELSHGTA